MVNFHRQKLTLATRRIHKQIHVTERVNNIYCSTQDLVPKLFMRGYLLNNKIWYKFQIFRASTTIHNNIVLLFKTKIKDIATQF